MTEVLLQTLTTNDIAWLKQWGQPQPLPVGDLLLQNPNVPELFIILEGTLQVAIAAEQANRLGQAFAALEAADSLAAEVGRFGVGELIGEAALLNQSVVPLTMTALEASLVLRVPVAVLQSRLDQDWAFAARFYRAIALLLLGRMEEVIETLLRRKRLQIQPLQNVPLLLSQLRDSDVDWLTQQGEVQHFDPGEVLIAAGRRPEYLYILLQGTLEVRVSPTQQHRLRRAFAALEATSPEESAPETELVRLEAGEMSGEIVIIDDRLAPATTRAIAPSLVLAIPRQQILLKLQQDTGFAARFYRVVAMLLSARMQGLVDRLGFGRGSYGVGSSLAGNATYADELELSILDQLSLGGARFEWMLKRLQLNLTNP